MGACENNLNHPANRCLAMYDSVVEVDITNPWTIQSIVDGAYKISDGGADMYDDGNIIATSDGYGAGNYVTYSDLCTVQTYRLTNKYYMNHQDKFQFVLFPDMKENNINIYGELGADGNGTAERGELPLYNGYRGFYKKVCDAGDPSVNHLFITNAPDAYHEINTHTDNDSHRLP
eukprot:UN04578